MRVVAGTFLRILLLLVIFITLTQLTGLMLMQELIETILKLQPRVHYRLLQPIMEIL